MNTGEDMFMYRCIELAKLGSGNVAPNPMVGAVLVHNEKIIGEGYHVNYGGNHAEVNCIDDAEKKLSALTILEKENVYKESTMYVSLEPCSHFGKTPPCADLLIQKNIGKVVIATKDPFKEVDGSGITRLQASGIKVELGMMAQESAEMNRRFFTFHQKKRPYIILKWAESSDRFISKQSEKNYAISNAYTNKLVHKWRSEEAAILVGTNTAKIDNPSLTTRLWTGRNPIRVVIDKKAHLDEKLNLFNADAKTVVFTSTLEKQSDSISFFKINDDHEFLRNVLSKLYELNVLSLIVEGGTKILQSFIDQQLWDEARIIRNLQLHIGEGVASPSLTGIQVNKEFKIVNDNIRICIPLEK